MDASIISFWCKFVSPEAEAKAAIGEFLDWTEFSSKAENFENDPSKRVYKFWEFYILSFANWPKRQDLTGNYLWDGTKKEIR